MSRYPARRNLLSIDGDGNGSILTIDAGSSVILSGLSLVDGSSAFGGAIRNLGALSMTACTLSGDSAVSGGGIFNDGTLIMVGSTLSGNSAGVIGGGISNAGTMSLTNCTVYGNTTPTGLGGGIYNYGSGTLTLNDCTISGNSATSGGGLYNYGSADATLDNTIVANSSTGGDIAGTVAGSNNLIDDATSSGGLTNLVNGNLVGVNPTLGVLRNNGGPTQTMALLPSSPAINAGASALVPAFLTTDQRGAPRDNGSSVDIGAFQTGVTTIVVTTLADQDDGTINSPVSGGTSLRDADQICRRSPRRRRSITFSPLLNGAIDLTDGPLPAITANMTIDGPGADILSIDGQGQSGILTISAGADVTFSGLTLTDGNATDGGVIDNGGTLTVINCTLSNNQSHGGGAIFNALNSVLTMTGCTLFDNSTVVGGGICNLGAANLTDCTLSGNTAVIGGGIYSYTGTLALNNCTVAGNKAEQGGGLFVILSPNTTLNSTIVADSVSGGDIYSETGGEKLVGSNNLVGDGNDDFGLTNTITGNPKLGPLAWNGGPTQTMALLTGSPAIGKGAALGVTIDHAASRLTRRSPTFAPSSTRVRRRRSRSPRHHRGPSRWRVRLPSRQRIPRPPTRVARSPTRSTGMATAATSRPSRAQPRSR